VIVRAERESDFAEIHAVVQAAFGDEPVGPLVDALRPLPGYLPELALVAEDEGEIVGYVMFSYAELAEGGRVLMLSPLGVRPDRQRQRIGSALVEEGLRRARERGEPVVIVEGDPRYYSRFGFRRASELGLDDPHEGIPDGAYQALAYAPDHPSGRVVYPPPFDEVG
jgi:putative acetyltransferase